MGEMHSALRTGELTPELGAYIGGVAEQERRFQNRRVARSVSIGAARESLHLAQVKDFCEAHLAGKITPTGYAKKKTSPAKRRAVVALVSDTHIGARLSLVDNPVEYGEVAEARRLEHYLKQVLDFKPQYRSTSELVLLLNGDMIEGLLLHDLRDGAPLAEQQVAFWHYFSAFVGHCAAQFPSVRVVCRPGNHGRNKVRHEGRATSSKWDGIEWTLYYGLMLMSRDLKNVTWDVDRKPLAIVDLFGKNLLVTHADTEVKIGNPDTKATANQAVLDRISSTRLYGCEIHGAAFGHYHMPRFHPGNIRAVYNGGLLPPNGHARTAGYIGEPCGQFLFESVPGHVMGDIRFVEVGPEQDADESLGQMITPFSLDK
jgi:hypothetical protein